MKIQETDNLVGKKYIVYMHTNLINNKKYIGITSTSVENRWQNGKGYKNQIFYRAILKYGWDNFKHEVLFDNLAEEQACSKEKELIHTFNTSSPKYGYNVALGGFNKSFGKSVAHIFKINVYQYDMDGNFIAKYDSAIDAAKILNIKSEGISHICVMNDLDLSLYGYRWFHEYKGDKIKSIVLDQKLCKTVYQYDINGNFISEYPSTMEAERQTGIINSAICACCKGKHLYTKEYRWSYIHYETLPKLDKKQLRYENNIKKQEKKVYQYSLDGNFIREYKSLSSVSEYGFCFKSVSGCCINKNKYKQYKGFQWFYTYQGDKCNPVLSRYQRMSNTIKSKNQRVG